MSKEFTPEEWQTIRQALSSDPERYGFPVRDYGSALVGSFNIRELGNPENRTDETWKFLAHICRQFDLLAVQEISDNLAGLDRLLSEMDGPYATAVSDVTGAFPGLTSAGERLAFIYNWEVVERTRVCSDISYDRSHLIDNLHENLPAISRAYAHADETYRQKMDLYRDGLRETEPDWQLKLPVFLSFIRTPYCTGFHLKGHARTRPFEFLVVNAHLYYGHYITDRRQEFNALMRWLLARFQQDSPEHPNFLLLGDLNLDFDNPDTDRDRIEEHMKTFDQHAPPGLFVNFPFLDRHPRHGRYLRTNARLDETFDQIGIFGRDRRLPSHDELAQMGQNPRGPDYGVFDFTELFSRTLRGQSYSTLTEKQKRELVGRYQWEVSDHMPLWLRLPLPTDTF